MGQLEGLTFRLWGHASVELRLGGFSLLLDPWFGANNHFDSFYAFPPMQEPSEADIARIQAIHISHIHVDHFCAKSLSRFSKSTPIFIAKYEDGAFREKIRALGFTDVIEVPVAPTETTIGPFRLSSVPSREDPAFNSLLIVRTKDGPQDQAFLFNTDFQLPIEFYDFLRMYYGKFTGCFAGYSPFGPFPTCYDFSKCESMREPQSVEEMLRTTQRHHTRHVSDICESLLPRWIVPYASGIRLLRRDQALHNRLFTPLAMMQSIETFGANVIEMRPGDRLSADGSLETMGTEPRDVPSEADLKPENFKSSDTIADLERDSNPIRDFFRALIERNLSRGLDRFNVEIELAAVDGIYTFQVLYERNSASLVSSSQDLRPDLSISYPAGAIRRVLSGEMTLPNVHFAYGFEARVRRIVAPIRNYLVHQWR